MLSADLKQKVLEAARREPSPVRGQNRVRTAALLVSALAVPLALFLAVGGIRVGPRPQELVVLTGLGALATAGVLLWVALHRGSRMLGRSRQALVAVAIAAPLAFLVWKVGFHAGLPNMSDVWIARPGFRCFALTLLLAAWPLGVLALLRRGSDPSHPGSLGLALGVAAGAVAAALVDLWCPVGHLRHLLLGHVLPMGLLGLVGMLVGRRVLALSAR